MAATIDSGAVSGTRASVRDAIATASASTGVDFSYLLQQAKLESGLNPTAKASTSSASGLYQFVEQSWLGVVKQHGAANGLQWASDAITRGSDGRYQVNDPETRRIILGLRNDPQVSATMAAVHASDNKGILESKLGRSVDSTDLYMAHFLGTAGATKFLTGYDETPDAAAASVLPAAARANHWIFYNKDGSARSFADIRAKFAASFDAAGSSSAPVQAKALPNVHLASLDASTTAAALGTTDAGTGLGGTTVNLLSPSPQYARLAYLMLASLGA